MPWFLDAETTIPGAPCLVVRARAPARGAANWRQLPPGEVYVSPPAHMFAAIVQNTSGETLYIRQTDPIPTPRRDGRQRSFHPAFTQGRIHAD